MAELSNFSNELRERTKKIHGESDRLINLKLAVVVTDADTWYNAVSQFYFVFKTLETALEEKRDDPTISAITIRELFRSGAFEKDLRYHFGEGWNGKISPSSATKTYCDRITEISQNSPILLIAYVHSMYLALLAGGQIVKKIVERGLGLRSDAGLDLFNFDEDSTKLKVHLKNVINDLKLSREQKEEIIAEKIRCFKMNNAIVRSIELTAQSYRRILQFGLAILIPIGLLCYLLFG